MTDAGGTPRVHECSRAVKCAGLFGARLRAGNAGHGTAVVGDSILVDLAKGLFAVGDSSDREPRAARMFMRHFADSLVDFSSLSPGAAIPDDRLDALQRAMVSRSRETLRRYPFQGTSTFTGLLLLRTDRRIRAVVFHAGDSLLFAYHPQSGVRRLTESNFWLIGKVREFYQVEFLDVAPGERFLLATDGLQDLSPPGGEGLEEYLAGLFRKLPVEDIPDFLIDGCEPWKAKRDDLALLALAPEGTFPEACEILMGGVTAEVETESPA
ncbi:MAG TPA: SpoIIE family protein phosphatase [Syntrophales bacterium]|nr:SpoIIE family protein phosphatase [Syntrophales bacterium]